MSAAEDFDTMNVLQHTYTVWFNVPDSRGYNGYYTLGITNDGKFLYTELRFYCDTIRRTFYKYKSKSNLAGTFLFEQTIQDFLAFMKTRNLTGHLTTRPTISDYQLAIDIFNELNKIIKNRCDSLITDN